MSRARTWCLALWAVFALAVFSDRFDWRTRQAGFDFIRAQAVRRAQGLPLESVAHGFRPLVRRAAWEAAAWAVPILLLGTGATLLVARRTRPAAF